MDHLRKIQLISFVGLLWAKVMGVASLALGFRLYHDLARRDGNGSVTYVVDKDHENIVPWSGWVSFGIAVFTSIVAPCILWLAERVRDQALADYEESTGAPLHVPPELECESMAGGLARLLLGGALIMWFLGSVSAIHCVESIKNGDAVVIHLNTAAQILSFLVGLAYVGFVWHVLETCRIVRNARARRPAAQAAGNGQAHQNGMEMRVIRRED